MAKTSMDAVLRTVRSLVAGQSGTEKTDGELLRAFANENDQEAFAALANRHGPFVLAICRRVLHQFQDAEDAFQATFIVLAKRAASLANRDSVSGWLHCVGFRIALNARKAAARRRRHERQSKTMHPTAPVWEAAWREVQILLDKEVQRLPKRYREPFVLCCLENESCAAAARRMGLKEGTVWSRLAEARKRLQKRLSRRGVELTAVLGAAALAPKPAMAAALVAKAVSAVTSTSTGARVLSDGVAVLVKEMTKTLFFKKAKLGMALFLAISAMVGVTAVAYQSSPTDNSASASTARPPAAKDQAGIPAKQERPIARDQFGDPLPDGVVARLGARRFRTGGSVNALAFSGDGKTLAGNMGSREVLIWDANTGQEKLRLPGRAYSRMAVSPDGKTLAFVDNDPRTKDYKVGFWDLGNGKLARTLSLDRDKVRSGPISAMGFAPDGKSLVISFLQDQKTIVLDITSAQVKITLGGRDAKAVNYWAIDPAGQMLAVIVKLHHEVQLWDIATGKLLRVLRELPRKETEDFSTIAFSPDGKILALGGVTHVFLLDPATGNELGQLKAAMERPTSLAFTIDGKQLVASSQYDCKARVWDLAQGKLLRTFGPGPAGGMLSLSPDGKKLVGGNNHRCLRLWDTDTGKQQFTEDQGHDSLVRSLAYSPDGNTLASGDDNTILFWNTTSKKRNGTLPAGGRAVSFSPNGRQLVTLGNSSIGGNPSFATEVHLWNLNTFKEVMVLKVPRPNDVEINIFLQYDVKSAYFSQDGRQIFTLDWFGSGETGIGNNCVRRWDVATGKQDRSWTLPPQKSWISSLAPDGKTVLAGVDGEGINVTDVASGRKRLLQLQLDGAPTRRAPVIASSDARVVASGRVDAAIRLWEVMTGKEIFLLKGHKASVYSAAWSPNGRIFASGDLSLVPHGSISTVRLWDTATGKELACFGGFKADILALAFSPDGSELAAALLDELEDYPILIFEVAKYDPQLAKERTLGTNELALLWNTLADENAGKAHQALWSLVAAPKQSVPFLRARLQPLAVADQRRIQQWIANLGSDKFQTRLAAGKELQKVGEQVNAAIHEAIKGPIPLEARRRLELIVNSLSNAPGTETVRTIRAIMALERIGSPEAQAVLETLARGAPGARETEEAKASLQRLAQRAGNIP